MFYLRQKLQLFKIIMAAFTIGILIFHPLFRLATTTPQSGEAGKLADRGNDDVVPESEGRIEKKEEEAEPEEERPNLSATNQKKITPSIEEDWGKVVCPLTELSEDEQNLHDYLTTVTLPCTFKVMIGGSFKGNGFHGEKWMCIDKEFKIKKNNCTVLSFGIFTDWTFDDEIDELFGCKLYAFDPTIGRENHNRSRNIQFFNLGISDGPGKLRNGKVDTYSAILKMLNLENTTIDYLKMDVEKSEYLFFKDVLANTPNLLKNVKQIAIEVHLPGVDHAMAWGYLQQLGCLGFKVMFYNFNPVRPVSIVNGRQRGPLYEMVWGLERNW